MKWKCSNCGTQNYYPKALRQNVRDFKKKYPFISNVDIAKLIGMSKSRVGEIINVNREKWDA